MSDTEGRKRRNENAFDEERFSELKTKSDEKTLTPSERLEYRKLSLSRRELALSRQKASLRNQERKADANRKIKLGGLVIAAGLGDWDEACLRGAFASIARTDDPELLARWRDAGGAQYDAEIRARRSDTTRLAVSFAAPPMETVRVALRAKGLAWNADRKRWEGTAVPAEIAAIAEEAGGRIEELDE